MKKHAKRKYTKKDFIEDIKIILGLLPFLILFFFMIWHWFIFGY